MDSTFNYLLVMFYPIGGTCIMISVLALSAVDRGFEPRSDQIKDYNISIC